MGTGIKKNLRRLIASYKDWQFKSYCRNNDAWLIDTYNLPPLSRQELQEVQLVWPCFRISDKDLTYLKMYKKEKGFDPYFLTDYYFQFILDKTNKYNDIVAFKNKAMYDVYMPKIPVGKLYSRNFGCGIKDDKMRNISRENEIGILLEKKQFIIKPSFDSGRGRGVLKVDIDKESNPKQFLLSLLDHYGEDYVTQEIIIQNSEIAKLNPSSLNTCRITTILLNGKITSSGVFKVGKMNSNVDNWHSSYFVGLTNDGMMMKFGYDSHLNKVETTDNGFAFEGRKIPFYDKMRELVADLHNYYFPHIGVLGWDVCIDQNNEVRVVEVNVDWPGIAGEQFCSGTFFAERREEIIKLLV